MMGGGSGRIGRAAAAAVVIVAAAVAAGTGCASGPGRPGLISHPVFITLEDPSRAGELIADCDRLLATIPEVRSYACGRPFDSGRATVDGSYDVGIFVAFDSPEDYAAYVVHPNHVELVEKWGPVSLEIRVHDVLDEEGT